MFKRKDYNLHHGEESSDDDEDEVDREADGSDPGAAAVSDSDDDGDSEGGEWDAGGAGRLQDISEDEEPDEPPGAPFKCALCPKVCPYSCPGSVTCLLSSVRQVLLLNDSTVLLHVQSKKHVKAAQKAGVDVRLPVYSSRGSPPPGLVEEEAETHAERLARVRKEAEDLVIPKKETPLKKPRHKGAKGGRQRQQIRKKRSRCAEAEKLQPSKAAGVAAKAPSQKKMKTGV